jgi:adenine-specific DNA-methyltransferase
MRKLFKTEAKQGMSSPSLWTDAGLNQHASSEIEDVFGKKASFKTPKPEVLMQRILHIASNPGDLVMVEKTLNGMDMAAQIRAAAKS